MDQVDLPERENALKNLEQNQRNLENEYLNAKSEGKLPYIIQLLDGKMQEQP